MAKILSSAQLHSYKAFIFDFDGVLVESNLIKKALFFKIWDELRDDKFIEESLKIGGSRYEVVERLYSFLVPSSLQNVNSSQDYIEKYTRLCEEEISELDVNSEIKSILENYTSSKLLFINSATPTKTLQTICKNLELDRYFEKIYGVEQSKKENFLDIFSQYSLKSNEVLYFGDMLSDKKVAEELDIDFVAVYSQGSDLISKRLN